MACVSLGPCIGIVFWAVLFPLPLLWSGRPPHENYHSMVVGMIPYHCPEACAYVHT